MLIANKYEVPDACPIRCPHKKDILGQGSFCTRCPVFLCKKTPDSSEYAGADGMFCVLEPENFREDWALIFHEWFKGDMITTPRLLL